MAHADSRVMGALEPRLDAGLRRGGIEAAVRVFVSETRGAGRKTHLAPTARLPCRGLSERTNRDGRLTECRAVR